MEFLGLAQVLAVGGAILGTGGLSLIRQSNLAQSGNPQGTPDPGLPLLRYARRYWYTPTGSTAPQAQTQAQTQSPVPDATTAPDPDPSTNSDPKPTNPDTEERKRRRHITVYRVEVENRFRRVVVGAGGSVGVPQNDNRVLWLNFGQPDRAQAFAQKLLARGEQNVTIKSFEVPYSFYEAIRAESVPERAQTKATKDRPIESRDPPRGTQFGLRARQIETLRLVIVQGTGMQRVYP